MDAQHEILMAIDAARAEGGTDGLAWRRENPERPAPNADDPGLRESALEAWVAGESRSPRAAGVDRDRYVRGYVAGFVAAVQS